MVSTYTFYVQYILIGQNYNLLKTTYQPVLYLSIEIMINSKSKITIIRPHLVDS